MPIIGNVGRKSLSVRILNICIHLILIAGGITMVYPFLIMFSGSVKSDIDLRYLNIIPKYILDERILFQKHLYTKYNGWFSIANDCLNAQLNSFEELKPPEDFPSARVSDWENFLKSAPKQINHYYYGLGAVSEFGIQPEMQRAAKRWLKEKYQGDLSRLNRELMTGFISWEEISYPREDFTQRRQTGDYQGTSAILQEFKENEAPQYCRYYFSLDGAFQSKLRRRYKGKLDDLNSQLNTDFKQWNEIHLTLTKPEGPLSPVWEEFVRESLNLQFIRVDDRALDVYRQFLKNRYRQDINFLNKVYETEYSSFDQIPLIENVPSRGLILSDWIEFVELAVPAKFLSIRSAEFYYRDFLKQRYETIKALNHAHGKEYKSFDTVNIPTKEWEWSLLKENKKHILREFLTRNYAIVIEAILLDGRSVCNTFVYCLLSVLAALIINPTAAYALSRYSPPSTYKLLLFLMLTIAFPTTVVGIPSFLLIKKLGLLNTYAALILPAMASGYSIFLLKGFFDSLPRELYECATIDGAGELAMFWNITMSLSKPILAVIALEAFTAAYGNFMLAFLVCPDPKMWTLMVHLYQLQQSSSQAVTFASLVVAAIPTFLIFVFCQNIILRGIVVPTEK